MCLFRYYLICFGGYFVWWFRSSYISVEGVFRDFSCGLCGFVVMLLGYFCVDWFCLNNLNWRYGYSGGVGLFLKVCLMDFYWFVLFIVRFGGMFDYN